MFLTKLSKVEQLEVVNRDMVATSLANQQKCANGRVAARQTLQKYQAAGLNWTVAPTALTDPTCTFENGQLNLQGVQNVQTARSDALDVARAFTDTASGDIGILSGYVTQRSAYDASYLTNKSNTVDDKLGEIGDIIDPTDIAADIVPDLTVNLTLVVNCLSANPPAGFDPQTCPGKATADALGDVLEDAEANVQATYDEAVVLLEQSEAAALQYQADTEARIAAMNEQIDNLQTAVTSATDTIDSLGDGVGIDPCGAGLCVELVPAYPNPDFPGENFVTEFEPNLDALPSLEQLDDIIQTDKLKADALQAVNETAEAVEDKVEQVAADVQVKVDEASELASPDDYEPPECCEYPPEGGGEDPVVRDQNAIEDKNENDVSTFENRHGAALNAFSESSTEDDLSSYNPPTFNASQFDLDELLAQSSFTFEFVPLTSADYPIDFLFGQLDGLVGLLIIMDFVWRGFRTITLIVRYYSKAALAGKPLDVRQEQAMSAGCRGCESSWSMFAKVALSPFAPLVIGVFLVFLVTSLVVQTYVPFFEDYTGGCVDNGQLVTTCNAVASQAECLTTEISQNMPCRWIPGSQECVWDRSTVFEPTPEDFVYGTLITDNLYSMAYNYASEDGNNEYWATLDDYNVRLSSNCAEYGQASAEELQSRERDYESTKSLLVFMRSDFVEMSSCLDFAQMDTDLAAALQAENADYLNPVNPFTADDNLAQYLNRADGGDHAECFVDVSTAELRDSRFNCEQLPECNVGCNGVEWDVVRTWTYGCGCYIEWWFHSNFLLFGLAIVIYICVNIGRQYFVSGICLLFYEKLGTNLFEYHGTCDREGNSLTDKKELRRQLKLNLRARSSWGIWYMLAATLLQVPWMVMLSLLAGEVSLGNLTAFSTCDSLETDEYVCNLG
jgi:hypothetical protein